MPDIQCWQCGSEIKRENILGVGEFTRDIGRLSGKGFIAFNCEDCEEIRYQILSGDHEILESRDIYPPEGHKADKFLPPENIELNQVINFHNNMKDVNSVDDFIIECQQGEEPEENLFNRPLNNNDDIIMLFEKVANTRRNRAMVVVLDEDRYLRSWDLMGPGTGNEINFEPRSVFARAMQVDFETMIYLVDNLKNDTRQKPSHQDIIAVKRLIKAGKILGITFKDKLVLSGDNFLSFRSLNLI